MLHLVGLHICLFIIHFKMLVGKNYPLHFTNNLLYILDAPPFLFVQFPRLPIHLDPIHFSCQVYLLLLQPSEVRSPSLCIQVYGGGSKSLHPSATGHEGQMSMDIE